MERLEQLAPEYLAHRSRKLRMASLFGAITVVSLSLLVLLLWVSRAHWIEQFAPSLLQMKVNTALAFGTLGGAQLALINRRFRLAAALAGIAMLIGILTLLEYFGVALPIDALFVSDWSAAPGLHPGRSAPNTATVFIVLGLCVAILAFVDNVRARNAALWLGPLIVIAVALEAIAGHIGQSPFAIGWFLQPMSIPSAMCALVLSAGLLAYGWQAETAVISRLPLWAPALYCFGIALLDLYTPLDVNVGIGCIPLVICALWFPRSGTVFVFATVATLLIVFGLFAAPPGRIAFDIAMINRGIDIACVWAVAILINHRQIAGKRLRYSEHHFVAAQKLAAVGSFELIFATMKINGSAMFDTMHGLPAGEPTDWSTFLRTAIPPDERGAMEDMIGAARAGAASRDLEYSFLCANGAACIGVMHCDLLRDAGGAPAGIIGVVHDVTALRRAQARQADIEGQLRHAQKLEALGMLAGSIAHDLNNTLVPITTLVPLLVEQAGAREERMLDVIMDAARRAKQLVREMLVYSSKDEQAREPIRLDRIVRESLTILRAGIPASIAIVDQLETVPEILGSKGQIYQTILNLATNAACAIGDHAGTITIGASCDGPDATGSGDIRLFVSDDGAGMDKATVARIFEPYFSTKSLGGTGLGLSIVNGIVKSHGGTIAVRSALGKGTRFDLHFPALAA